MPEGNPLVAAREDSTTAYTGIGIAESAMDLYHGVENKSWIEGGLGGLGTGLEALSLALDPVGTLVQYGVSWLMEHVKPLSDALDWLAGDADQIAAYAQTWKNVATETGKVAQDFGTEVAGGTAGWQGEAAEAYRARAVAQQDKITAAGTGAGTIGTVVEIVGILVGAVREIVRDLVAECVATLIARIPQWIAEIGGTLGAATPHVVGSAIALIAKWVNRIKDFLVKLTRSLDKLRPMMKHLGEIWDAIRNGLRHTPDGPVHTPDPVSPVRTPDGSTTPSGSSTPGTTKPDSATPGSASSPAGGAADAPPGKNTGATPDTTAPSGTAPSGTTPSGTTPSGTTPSGTTPSPDTIPVRPPHPDTPQAGGFGSWPTQNETPGGAVGQHNSASCSSACGEMLSGGRLTQDELIEQIGAPSDAAALARGLGEGWQGGYIGPENFDRLMDRVPVAVEMYDGGRMGHTVVVDGLDEAGNVRIRDPWNGGSTYTMTPADFHQYWNGNAVFK